MHILLKHLLYVSLLFPVNLKRKAILSSLPNPTTSTEYGIDFTEGLVSYKRTASVFLYWLCNTSEWSYNADDTTTWFKLPEGELMINRKT